MGEVRAHLIPWSVKVALAAWLVVWLPLRVASRPLPTMLAFCVFGSVILVIGICLEHRLLVSWQALALTIPQLVYIGNVVAGGAETAYLFDQRVPIDVRALSYYHFVIPAICMYGVWRLGYDRRALPLQIVTAAVVLAFSSRALDVNLVGTRGFWTIFAALVLIAYLPAHYCYDLLHERRSSSRRGGHQRGAVDRSSGEGGAAGVSEDRGQDDRACDRPRAGRDVAEEARLPGELQGPGVLHALER